MIDLDDGEQVRLHDSMRRLDLAADWQVRLAAAELDEIGVDVGWLESCFPQVERARNPAKQLALRLYDRAPLFWSDSRLAALAGEWQQWVMQDAEAAALHADLQGMARDWSMVRLPRFWTNAIVCVWLTDGREDANERRLADQVQLLLQKRHFQTIEVAIPAGQGLRTALWYGRELGRWVALYLAALYGVDPAARTGWEFLGVQPPDLT